MLLFFRLYYVILEGRLSEYLMMGGRYKEIIRKNINIFSIDLFLLVY